VAGTPRSRASDLTGRQIEAANDKRDAEIESRAQELSMVTAAAKEAISNEIIDLSNPSAPVAIAVEEIEEIEVQVAEKEVTIRVNENIDMTYGGVSYKMDVGPKYKVAKHIADWLEEKGIVWH
jgi:hypothetical protein